MDLAGCSSSRPGVRGRTQPLSSRVGMRRLRGGGWRGRVGLVLVLALLAAACADAGEAEPPDEDVVPVQDATESGTGISDAGLELSPLAGPQLGDYDRERLLEAARTLDPEALCPLPAAPESLDDVAEVLRIDGGCAIIEYVDLEGRSVREVREQILSSDPTAHAVGLPPRDLQPDALQASDYDGPPPDAYDDDSYGAGDWWHLDRLDAETLWDPYGWDYLNSRTGLSRRVRAWPRSEVIVAVIDSGTDEHRDLEDNFAQVDGGSWLDNACQHDDHSGHGTHVAGLIAAEQGNSQDVAGLAPDAKILPIKLWGSGKCSAIVANLTDAEREAAENAYGSDQRLTASQAVLLAAEAGARVINMSFWWADDQGDAEELDDAGNDVFEANLDLIRETYGVVPVTSAGNCGHLQDADDTTDRCAKGKDTKTFPKAYSTVITVAATDQPDNRNQQDQRRSTSTSNEYVDIAAPGDNILSTVPLLTCIATDEDEDGTDDKWKPLGCGLSSPPSACPSGTPLPTSIFNQPGQCAHRVIHKSGTSMAAPLVSAVVAHMIARYPQATPNMIEYSLLPAPIGHESDLTRNDQLGWGSVDPKLAIERLDDLMDRLPQTPTGVPTIPAIGSDDSPVSLAVGDSAQGQPGCSSQHCAHLKITLDAPAGNYNVACWSSLDLDNPWHSSTWHWPTSSLWSEGGCWFGFPGEQVWVTVNGIQSNTITWPHTNTAPDDETPPPPTVSATFKAVSAGAWHTCGLRIDDTISCWGRQEWELTDAPDGAFTAVSAGYKHSCALRTDGTIECWGDTSFRDWRTEQTVQWDPPAGTFSALSGDCGVRTDGSWECLPNRYGVGYDGRDRWCGRNLDGSWECWEESTENQLITPPVMGNEICGLRAGGRLACLADDDGWQGPPKGSYSAVAGSCALSVDGTVICWYGGAPAGTFSAITSNEFRPESYWCGLRADGTIECWGANDSGQTDAPHGAFTAVSTGDRHACALRTDGAIICWGDNSAGQTDVPGGHVSAVVDDGDGLMVILTEGGLGPTSLGPGEGVPCAPDTPRCRYLRIEFRGFAPGEYTVSCSHDGWGDFGPSTFWTFSITVDSSGSASSNGPCFLNFARLTSNGAYVTVSRPGTETVVSNWLK